MPRRWLMFNFVRARSTPASYRRKAGAEMRATIAGVRAVDTG